MYADETKGLTPEVTPGERLLLGPGPSNVDSRVLRAMSSPVIGHLDAQFLGIMEQTMDLLKYLWQTSNELTMPMSGTGSAGMETCFVNLLEPGDSAVVCVHGVFGQRMADIAERCGARLTVVEAPWGEPIEPAAVRRAVSAAGKPRLVSIVHAETSTGVLQPLDEIAAIAHGSGALFLVDAVTSLGGVPVPVTELDIDAVYSATQKCLSCPPGLAPISFNDRAWNVVTARKHKVASWYLDLTMIRRYWGQERFYHHTAPVSMIYGLCEGLRIIREEGLENRWARHLLNYRALVAGLEAMGLKLLVKPPFRLPSLTTVVVPEGIDDAVVRGRLVREFGIEIGGGLGELKGKVWRVGLMGHSSQRKNVLFFLGAFGSILSSLGYRGPTRDGIAAAERVYEAGG